MKIVYYSGRTNNTHKFVSKLEETDVLRIAKEPIEVDDAYVLVVPTYGNGIENKVVPFQVRRFFENPKNRQNLVGIIGAGNTNFASDYCAAAKQIARKFNKPVLYQFELLGTPTDVLNVNNLLHTLQQEKDSK